MPPAILEVTRQRRISLSARRDLGRAGRQLLAVLRQRDESRTLPVRRQRQQGTRADRTAGIHQRNLARLSARRPPRHDLRLSRARAVRTRGRPSLQSEQALPRSLCQGACRQPEMGSRRLRLHDGRGDDLTFDERDSARFMPKSRVIDPAFTWGRERAPSVPWDRTIIYETHVRGYTKLHPAVPRTSARHLCRPRPQGSRRLHQDPRRHIGRTAARSMPLSTTATCWTRA